MDRSDWNRRVAISRWERQNSALRKIIEANCRKYPKLKARILGYLMGDGSVTVRKEKNGTVHYQICFYPDDVEMLYAFLFAFHKLYSRIPRIKKNLAYYEVRIESKVITLDLLSAGSFNSLEWRVPLDIQSSNACVREFIRAFYDCEAYVGKKEIVVQSVNINGLLDVQNLLTRFGICSKIYSYTRKNPRWNKNYLLRIGKKENRARFLKRIGFTHARKRAKLYADVA